MLAAGWARRLGALGESRPKPLLAVGARTPLDWVVDALDAVEALNKARLLYTLIEPGGGLLVGLPEAGERIADLDARVASFPAAP